MIAVPWKKFILHPIKELIFHFVNIVPLHCGVGVHSGSFPWTLVQRVTNVLFSLVSSSKK